MLFVLSSNGMIIITVMEIYVIMLLGHLAQCSKIGKEEKNNFLMMLI